MNIKKQLEMNLGAADGIHLNDVEIDPLTIKAVMINEVQQKCDSRCFHV